MALCKDCNTPAIPGERYCKMHLKFADQRRPMRPQAEMIQPRKPFAEIHRHNEQLRQSGEWKRLSRELRAAHPYCSICGNTTDLQVHHIIAPADGDRELYFNLENLAVICKACHSVLNAENLRRQQ